MQKKIKSLNSRLITWTRKLQKQKFMQKTPEKIKHYVNLTKQEIIHMLENMTVIKLPPSKNPLFLQKNKYFGKIFIEPPRKVGLVHLKKLISAKLILNRFPKRIPGTVYFAPIDVMPFLSDRKDIIFV